MQTRETQTLLEGNRRRLDHHTQAISQAGASKDASLRDLGSAFRRRDQAIKYCRVVNLAKDNHALAALKAARHVELSYLIEKLSAALGRRLSRLAGWDSA